MRDCDADIRKIIEYPSSSIQIIKLFKVSYKQQNIQMQKNRMQSVPSHRTFKLGNITISSDFDSGNCSHAEKISSNTFELWINGDHQKNNYRVWFYFWIEGIAQDTTVTFTIKNMQNQSRLINDGLLPVYRTEDNSSWQRISTKKTPISSIEFYEGNMEWTFQHDFKKNKRHYISLFSPWSNDDQANFLKDISSRALQNKNIYFYWACICRTIEERPIDFLVITSQSGKDQKPIKIDDKNLFQQHEQPESFFSSKKKCIVISARVHPGEVPSSHVMTGIISTLIENNKRAQKLRENFVFYLFPMLNPDGVGRGHYRVDTNGINLNRCYLNPSPQLNPTIYALKTVINHVYLNNKFFAFLDLHAHPAPRGNFMYGNSSNQLKKQLQACLFPKILSMNTTTFDYQGSNFTQENMYTKDKGDHISKQGSGRVAMYRLTKNPQCWTLECGHHLSKFSNILDPQRQQNSQKLVTDIENLRNDIICNYYEPKTSPFPRHYKVDTFRELGSQICESFLDLINDNPHSRIENPNSYFKTMVNFKLNLAVSLLRESPNKFESNFNKAYFAIAKNQKSELRVNAVKALYYLLIKNIKISNTINYIKTGDQKQLALPSPPKKPSGRNHFVESPNIYSNKYGKNGEFYESEILCLTASRKNSNKFLQNAYTSLSPLVDEVNITQSNKQQSEYPIYCLSYYNQKVEDNKAAPQETKKRFPTGELKKTSSFYQKTNFLAQKMLHFEAEDRNTIAKKAMKSTEFNNTLSKSKFMEAKNRRKIATTNNQMRLKSENKSCIEKDQLNSDEKLEKMEDKEPNGKKPSKTSYSLGKPKPLEQRVKSKEVKSILKRLKNRKGNIQIKAVKLKKSIIPHKKAQN